MRSKKRLAAQILKTSPKKIKFVADALEDIKKAITKADIRGLIAIKKINKSKKSQQSRVRAKKSALQKKKGRQKGQGSRKGKTKARTPKKTNWMIKVRNQRRLLKLLKEKELISSPNYRQVYLKIKGGFFRNKRHLKLYLDEHKLIEKK